MHRYLLKVLFIATLLIGNDTIALKLHENLIKRLVSFLAHVHELALTTVDIFMASTSPELFVRPKSYETLTLTQSSNQKFTIKVEQ